MPCSSKLQSALLLQLCPLLCSQKALPYYKCLELLSDLDLPNSTKRISMSCSVSLLSIKGCMDDFSLSFIGSVVTIVKSLGSQRDVWTSIQNGISPSTMSASLLSKKQTMPPMFVASVGDLGATKTHHYDANVFLCLSVVYKVSISASFIL